MARQNKIIWQSQIRFNTRVVNIWIARALTDVRQFEKI